MDGANQHTRVVMRCERCGSALTEGREASEHNEHSSQPHQVISIPDHIFILLCMRPEAQARDSEGERRSKVSQVLPSRVCELASGLGTTSTTNNQAYDSLHADFSPPSSSSAVKKVPF